MEPISDQPNSIYHIHSIHMYALQSANETDKVPTFALLVGETVLHSGNSVDGVIFITNYRLFMQIGENQFHIPLGLVEQVEIRDLFYIQLYCKDARTYRCIFENNESALEWYDRIFKAIEPPRQVEQLFAFYHCVWAKEKGGEEMAIKISNQKKYTFDKDMFENEMIRMQFKGDSWRISKANENYKICSTYPPYLLVPSCINDEILESVAKFRSSKRIPVAVWRHTRNGAVIARCSQPEVGWFGWRATHDEDLLKAISDACNFDRTVRSTSTSDKDSVLSHSPGSLHSDESLQITGEVIQQEKKLLIIDARSYTTAVANRARGGGCECPEYYPNSEIQFMNLANIHSIRKSFQALRQLCISSAEQPNWFSLLEGTRWLLHMSGLFKSAVIVATAIERDSRPVLVHCSDGWDRTPQIVALAELLLDPYYRTIDGFRVLIEREWLAFGHKFADRCGHSGGSEDLNERCPVFLQWLDCVHQLLTQFPVSFEFSHNYLIKLAQHIYSNLYGTFLCNTYKQRMKISYGKTFSVWEFLNSLNFKNNLYSPVHQTSTFSARVLWPKTNVRDLRVWSEVYLDSVEVNFNPGECPGPPNNDLNGQNINMAKTRSYGDLINADISYSIDGGRRNSDPNINRELKLVPHETTNIDIIDNNSDNNTRCNNYTESAQNNVRDFFPSDNIMEDNFDCNQDCIFNNIALTDDQVDGLKCLVSEKLKLTEESLTSTTTTDEIAVYSSNGKLRDSFEEALLFLNPTNNSIRKENYDLENDSSTQCEKGSSKTDNDINIDDFFENEEDGDNIISTNNELLCKSNGLVLEMEKSNETSTETLVSDHHIPGSSPKEYNGFEKIQTPMEENEDELDSCKICQQSNSNNVDNLYANNSLSKANDWNENLSQKQQFRHHNQLLLGEDGLIPIRSTVQERLDQIIDEYKKKLELLEKELHVSRQILIKQACHKCLNEHGETRHHEDGSSVEESVNSTNGDGHISAVESLRSDLSWVDVEETTVAECQGILWVPDHAVSRCTGCSTEFWLGRRRHHCRKCGKIFCADCSEHATPLPSEQLYNPVRVCSGCYSQLRIIDDDDDDDEEDDENLRTVRTSMNNSLQESCKSSSGNQPPCSRQLHTQIAASSN